MQATILVSIGYLATPIEVNSSMKFMSYNDLIRSGMFDEEFRLHYGEIFQYDIQNRYHWAVKILDIAEGKELKEITDIIIDEMALIRMELQNFFNFLWVVRDNNISVCNQYGFVKGIKETYLFLNDKTDYCSDGRLYDWEFKKEDVAYARSIYDKYLSRNKNHQITIDSVRQLKTHGENISPNGAIAGQINLIHYDEYSRIERAVMFLGGARAIEFLPSKIAMYMQSFEALFATEAEGVSFKVPLRVAHYMGEDRASKQFIFESLRDAYHVRSRYLHGDRFNDGLKLKMKMEDFVPISYNTDDILRRTMRKIILDDMDAFLLPTNDNKETGLEGLRTYFNNLVFQ